MYIAVTRSFCQLGISWILARLYGSLPYRVRLLPHSESAFRARLALPPGVGTAEECTRVATPVSKDACKRVIEHALYDAAIHQRVVRRYHVERAPNIVIATYASD